MKKNDWLYLGLGITGFLALVSYRKGTPTPAPPKGNPKSIAFQVDPSGSILVHTAKDVAWTSPKLAEDKIPQFRQMVAHWKEIVDEAVLDYRVPESWIWAIMWAESKGDPRAGSPKGAMGLMQVMPYHFKETENPYDPRTNVRAGVRWIQSGRGKVNNLVQIASYYNAGGPWTNETWLAAHRRPDQTTSWGFPAEPGYIDTVIAANNTFLSLGIGASS